MAIGGEEAGVGGVCVLLIVKDAVTGTLLYTKETLLFLFQY